MHFSKTYQELLLSLPPELRQNAIQYRQLKKLINQIVVELASLGLSPSILEELLESNKEERVHGIDAKKGAEEADGTESISSRHQNGHLTKLIYEVTDGSGHIEPHLRLWVDAPPAHSGSVSGTSGTLDSSEADSESVITKTETSHDVEDDRDIAGVPQGQMSLLWALQRQAVHEEPSTARITEVLDELSIDNDDDAYPETDASSSLRSDPSSSLEDIHVVNSENTNEVVIPLVSDMVFFQTLQTAINDLSAHLVTVQGDFVSTLTTLAHTISDSARPTSASTSGFHPHSGISSKPWSVSNSTKVKSDLYSWREIFQLYIEAEVFESVHEMDHGERSVEESENRLKLFAERVTTRGLGDDRKLKSKSSKEALETFLELNLFILNIKKFQFANSEATRKILKKHTKRTHLPIMTDELRSQAVLPARGGVSKLPRLLVQAIGEKLLPIIPHLDDYACLICTSIAFKPIRLSCGHLFCVRCLVKMQKRGKGDCPMCRAPCVLTADRSNVDWALLNFMQDWFPVEAQEKLEENQKEAAREEMEEHGMDPDATCKVM